MNADGTTIAYLRGDDVLVAMTTRAGLPTGSLDAVGGRWRDVLYGDERVLDSSVPLTALLGEYGIAVLELLVFKVVLGARLGWRGGTSAQRV